MDKTQLDHSIQNQSEDKKLNNITLSDGTTKLLDVVSAISDYDKFSKFLENLENVNAIIPHDSPFWPGCTVFHFAVMKGTKLWVELQEESYSQQPLDNPTEEDEMKYRKTIDLCLASGCSVMKKNAEGVTPIHLAFKLHDKQITDLLLSRCDNNLIKQDQTSFFHIACATGNADVVKRLLKKGADLESQMSISFEWFTKCCSRKSKPDPITVPVNSTALHIAAMCQNKEIVELLMNIGANIYAQNTLGLTPIHLSMVSCDMFRHSDCKVIAQLLLKKALILRESVSNSGLSHLHVAAYADDANAIEKLLQMGSDVDRIFKIDEPELSHLAPYANKTPLHIAICALSHKAVATLIMSGADISQQTTEIETPLQYFVRKRDRDPEVLCWIKNKFRHTNEAIDVNGTTALHVACHTFDFEWAKELLEKGANVNAQILNANDKCRDFKDCTPLHILINVIYENMKEGKQKIESFVKLLIEFGANLLTINRDGQSSLLLARNLAAGFPYDGYFNDYQEYDDLMLPITDLLLESQESYEINPVDLEGFSHFHYACTRNQIHVVKQYLDNGIDINRQAAGYVEVELGKDDAINFAPLHFAVCYRNVEVACFLIERGANVNAVSEEGETPLHVALRVGLTDFHLFEMFLRNGADMSVLTVDGLTPINYLFENIKMITHEQFKVFMAYISTIDLSIEKYEGTMGLAMKNAKPCDREIIFEELIELCGVKNATKNNVNPIENLVAVRQESELNLNFYLNAIQRFTSMGCKLDQQNDEGQTALRKASIYHNVEAVEALLLLGANVNIIDKNNKSPINVYSYYYYKPCIHVTKMLAAHVWKMTFVGLKVHEICKFAMLEAHKNLPPQYTLDKDLPHQCEDELAKLSKENIGGGFTIKSFLGDSNAVMEYSMMPLIQRENVDQFFANSANLRQIYPQLSGLLTMQYRKALDRKKLHENTINLLPSVLQIYLPYLCLENILRYFSNDELKYFIEGHEDPVPVSV